MHNAEYQQLSIVSSRNGKTESEKKILQSFALKT